MSEQVNHPAHYGGGDNPYEAIKVIEAWKLGFCLGNAVKYIRRAGCKGDALTDLQKALWYLDRHIASLGSAAAPSTSDIKPAGNDFSKLTGWPWEELDRLKEELAALKIEHNNRCIEADILGAACREWQNRALQAEVVGGRVDKLRQRLAEADAEVLRLASAHAERERERDAARSQLSDCEETLNHLITQRDALRDERDRYHAALKDIANTSPVRSQACDAATRALGAVTPKGNG